MVIRREQVDIRKIKALTIVGLNQIKRVSATFYKVKSQSSEQWYDVKVIYGIHGRVPVQIILLEKLSANIWNQSGSLKKYAIQ